MSIPPHLIRIKRKRDDETPVTFLQFDQGTKRHRSTGNWAYQRRQPGPQPDTAPRSTRDVNPVIHVSSADNDATHVNKSRAVADVEPPAGSAQADSVAVAEPRRFHISRKMMMAGKTQPATGVSKKTRYGPAVFVERSRTKAAARPLAPSQTPAQPPALPVEVDQAATTMALDEPVKAPRLKKPGVRSRGHSPNPDTAVRAPLPASAMNPHSEEMSKIAADMNNWVLNEIGANLQSMNLEKQQAERARFKPKAPAKRYTERHPGAPAVTTASVQNEVDMAMTDGSDMDDDEDDWVIEEYVRIPAHAMMVDIAPAEVGLLVLDGEEDSNLFFGPDHDDDDDLDEDDEDENAENYYTADYPEDEVESDDEYGRRAYGYRNGVASDDEEFDNEEFDEDNEDEMVLEGGDDDATMARIKAYMKRSRAFR